MTAPDMPNGWPHVEYEAKELTPAASPHFGAAITERQLVRLFSVSTDAEARTQLADWNYRLDWQRVMVLRGLAQAAHDAEDGTTADYRHAQDAYTEALTSLALDARRAADQRCGMSATQLVRQHHDYGCGIASLAMIGGKSYNYVREWLLANWQSGADSYTSEEWLAKRGIHKGIADFFLGKHGFVWRTLYEGWRQEPWPPEPFAPAHLVQVLQPSNNTHYVVMRADGVVLDPMTDEPRVLTDWPKIYNVQGVWTIGGAA